MEPTVEVQPPVFYFGTPVVLVTTLNADGSTNISPLSSAWALGDRYVLGLGADGHAWANLSRRPELVINLASSALVTAIEAMAPATGSSPVPPRKQDCYTHVADKWALSGLTPTASLDVRPARITQCPVQLEARIVQRLEIADGAAIAIEAVVVRSHVHTRIVGTKPNRINTDTWDPLYYTFREYFAQGERVGANFRAQLLDEAMETA